MSDNKSATRSLHPNRRFIPAQPLWRLAPTRTDDGRCLADFMMLIPRLGKQPELVRYQIAQRVREVCESYGEQVVFADMNYAINVLWVTVAAEPGLAGRVAHSIRGRVPQALLIGGHIGLAQPILQTARASRHGRLWTRVRDASRHALKFLESSRPD